MSTLRPRPFGPLSSLVAFLLVACGASQPDGAPLAATAANRPDEPAAAAAETPAPPTTAIAPPGGARGCLATSPRAKAVQVAVFPDDGEAPYADVIASATHSLRVFGYIMGNGAVLDGLIERARAGVSVRVILDGETQRDVNDKYKPRLEEAGAEVVYSDPAFRYMHAKTIVADEARALVSTGNYARSFMLRERNFAADLRDPDDVADLIHLFDADFKRTSPTLTCTRLVVSPINSRARIVDLIKSATKEVRIESMQLADRELRDALIERKRAGVAVSASVADPTWIDANASAAALLGKEGIEVRYVLAPHVHVKAILVDGAWAYLGSENLSATSLDKNREIGVFVSDTAALKRMNDTFQADWVKSTAF